MFRRFPRSGIPDQFDSWSEYEEYLDTLVELHCIDNGKKVWWDLRPHPLFGTLEFRICDVPTSPRVTVALAALAQAIVVKLYRLRRSNLGFRIYSRALVEENKWRAARYGLDGRLIDFGKRRKCRCASSRSSCSSSWTTWWTSSGSRRRSSYVHTILAEGTSADRQLAGLSSETGDLRAVVRWLVEETRAGNEEVDVKVGLLCGREYSFPPAFIDRVNTLGRDARHHGGDRDADRHEDGRAAGVPRHRRSHLARGRVLPRLPEARGARRAPTSSTTRSGGRPTTSSSTTRSRSKLGVAMPKTVVLPQKSYPAGHRPDRRVAAQPRLPDRLGRAARLRRPAGDPEAVLGRRLEARLQGARPRGAARRLRRHRAVLHDAAAVHQLRSSTCAASRSARPTSRRSRYDAHERQLSRRARVPVARSSARASSGTRRRSTRRSATR